MLRRAFAFVAVLAGLVGLWEAFKVVAEAVARRPAGAEMTRVAAGAILRRPLS